MNDDQIQQILDEGGDLTGHSDVQTYRKLFEYLDHPESYRPAPGFAHRVSSMIDFQESQRSYAILIPVLLGGLVLMASGVYLVFYMKLAISFAGPIRMLSIMFVLALVLTGIYKLIERRLLS